MAREIPEVVRAAAGLAATVLDEARKLPETLPGLPVRLIGLAMQQAMKVQQQYAGFVARGDELFTGLRGEDEPGLATFDEDLEPAPASTTGFGNSAFDRATAEPTSGTDDVPGTDEILDEIAIDDLVDQAPTLEETAPTAGTGTAAADTLDAEPSADVATTVDVLTPDGEVTSVEGTVTDEGVAAPEGAGGAAASAPATRSAPAKKAAAATTAPAAKKAAPAKKAAGEKAAAAAAPADTATPTTGTNAGPATATDEGGTPVAAATGVRTDVGPADTSAEDSAIAAGAAVDAIGADSAVPTDDPEGGSELSGSQAAGTAPIEGYDGFSIAQLRGRMRGYALSTVAELVAYEEATRARAPYLSMLRNRLEKLEADAVAASPLAPRGA